MKVKFDLVLELEIDRHGKSYKDFSDCDFVEIVLQGRALDIIRSLKEEENPKFLSVSGEMLETFSINPSAIK